jgi:hypothetical protein
MIAARSFMMVAAGPAKIVASRWTTASSLVIIPAPPLLAADRRERAGIVLRWVRSDR